MKKIIFICSIIFLLTSSYGLKISEVYFDGYDEYLGIYNETNQDFSGQVIISGAKTSNFSINLKIPGKTEIIIGDNGIEMYFSGYKPFTTGLTLSISDTSAINIDILDNNGNLLDNFQVDEAIVNQYNNKNTAFEKIIFNTGELIKAVKTGVNNAKGYLVNPGFVQDLRSIEQENPEDTTNNNESIENTNIVYKPILCKVNYTKSGDIYNFYFTGNFSPTKVSWYLNNKFIDNLDRLSTGINQDTEIIGVGYGSGFACSGTVLVNIKESEKIIDNTQNFFTGNLKITEIHPKEDNFPEYIELQAIGNFSGNVIFSGLGRGSSTWQTQISLYSGNYLVIAKSLSGFKTNNIKIYSSMSLLDDGEELKILDTNGTLLFETSYSQTNENLSYYPTLKENNIPSPGFDLEFLKYYKIQQEENTKASCKILLQSQGITSDHKLKINLDSEVSNPDFCENNYQQIWTYSGQVLSSGTCNPYYFYFPLGTGNIKFEIKDLSGNVICSDNYNFIYTQETITKTITETKYMSPTPDLCVDKLNSTELKQLVNGISLKYSTTTQKRIFSPIKSLFHDDFVKNITTGDCYNLNSSEFKSLLKSLKNKYSETTLKYILSPYKDLISKTTYIKSSPYECKNLNSKNLELLTNLVKNKYSDTTLKRIYKPIAYLFTGTNFTSRQLRQIVEQTMSKYSTRTLKYIFNPVKSLFVKNKTGNVLNKTKPVFTGNIKIIKILANPKGKDIKEILVLSGNYISGLQLKVDNKIYKLTNPRFSGNLIIFSGNLHLKNNGACLSIVKNSIIFDKKCYSKALEGKWISNFSSEKIHLKNLKINFSGDYIFIYSNNYLIQSIENKHLIQFKKEIRKKLKKALDKIEKVFKKYKKANRKLNKLYIEQLAKSVRYYQKSKYYQKKYKQLKQEKSLSYKKYLDKLRQKNKYIKNLKQQISYLKSVIQAIKNKLDKSTYQKYLKLYKQVKQGLKIKFDK